MAASSGKLAEIYIEDSDTGESVQLSSQWTKVSAPGLVYYHDDSQVTWNTIYRAPCGATRNRHNREFMSKWSADQHAKACPRCREIEEVNRIPFELAEAAKKMIWRAVDANMDKVTVGQYQTFVDSVTSATSVWGNYSFPQTINTDGTLSG